MKANTVTSFILALTLLLTVAGAAFAQDMTPNVQVAATGIVDDTVTILEATVDGPGWVVIHADKDGSPGPVIGYAPLEAGVNTDVTVEIDADAATPILHAMLHVDEGEAGAFEFPGPDGPVTVEDAIVMAQFSAAPVVTEPETAEEEMSDDSMSEESTEAGDMADDEMTAPEAMPMTGASASTPFILGAAVMGLLALGANIAFARRRI